MHHFHIDKATYKLLKKRQTGIDKFTTAGGVAVQLATVPQILEIFTNKDAGSVSMHSWLTYTFYSVLALAYAIVHGLRPLVLMNSLGLIVNTAVVMLTIIY